ncbi:MAG TPA: dihydropteroate synthase [Acidimicrobiales bacterium]|nr:dihydropteroate synthase [Acidimicrobiales bacterium]
MRPQVMGVLNVTPDSFSDGGAWADLDAAVAHGRALLDEGADVVDVGGESTRPGADPVGIDVELARVVPVLEALSPVAEAAGRRLSVDTRHAEVAAAALAAGATIVNDVSASLEQVAASAGAAWVAMHMKGEPATMQRDPRYDDVVTEVLDFLVEAAERGRRAGVEEVWIDPGIGFGKTADHSWTLLGALDQLVATRIPVLVGTSRKGFLGAAMRDADGTDEVPGPDDRLEGSITTAAWAATMGAAMIRVHDVRATVAALDAVASAGAAG